MKTRLEQLEIELAFEKGAKIEVIIYKWKDDFWSVTPNPNWNWIDCDYRIKQEPKRVPFDGSDAFNLVRGKFRSINDIHDVYLCTQANDKIVTFSDFEVTYDNLAKYYEKWNDLLKLWESCSKIK